jgi:hypothetical protein
MLLIRDPLNQVDQPRDSWQYLTGQQRVRRMPTVAYDAPNADVNGTATYDDFELFNGSLDRYNWKILGEKEMFIPYNNYKADKQYDLSTIYTPLHLNPDYFRWELHRVWMVEAKLKDNKRHLYDRRVFLIDEDSWVAVLSDSYDGRGGLWRTNIGISLNAYELPGVVQRAQVYYDLQKDAYSVHKCQTEFPKTTVYGSPKEDDYFSLEQVQTMTRKAMLN